MGAVLDRAAAAVVRRGPAAIGDCSTAFAANRPDPAAGINAEASAARC